MRAAIASGKVWYSGLSSCSPMLPEKLTPPEAKGHVSVARLTRFWYVACRSEELGKRPISRTICGVPLVIFRSRQGEPAALLDRCPHRNVPLSLGRVVGEGALECAYHGWQFAADGRCRHVPGLSTQDERARERRVPSAAACESDGFVWVYPELDARPASQPFRVPVNGALYSRVVREVETAASLHATVENALDVPHTAFLHRGLFRGGKSHEIVATLRRFRDRVEVRYDGEPRPSGIAGRVLSPSGGTVEHWDRFILPSIAQVEYRLGRDVHFLVTSLCTPERDFRTRMWAVVEFRTRLPARAVRFFLTPFALGIFGQDARMLRAQADNIHRFGGEQYLSTELDFLGPHVWRLMKQAEAGEQALVRPDAPAPGDDVVVERAVKFFA